MRMSVSLAASDSDCCEEIAPEQKEICQCPDFLDVPQSTIKKTKIKRESNIEKKINKLNSKKWNEKNIHIMKDKTKK